GGLLDVTARQREMRLAEDGRQRIVDLVGHARGQLADRRELFGANELGLGELQLLELPLALRIELGVVERNADLVSGRLEQRHLELVEVILGLAAERKRAEDAATAADRYADEAADVIGLHGALGRGGRLGMRGGGGP